MSADKDALRFLELLYGTEPPGLILICEGRDRSWKPHACQSPQGAVYYVLGNVDVYHRVGLVDRKPQSGRGKAADTTALTAVWLDIDVDGSPDGKGGVVTGAAPTFDAAVDLHHSVLEPTFTVASGYGVHGYLRLHEPWLLRTDDDRRHAQELVRGWHERIKREAQARGMAKFDSVFDLARVLRPVGSLNGKGTEPRPVELLDDGGPRYTVEQIGAETVAVDEAPPAGEASSDQAREVLARHEDLTKIAARKGTKPGDGSGHAWDFMLGCRAAEHGYGDDVLAALIRHARKLHSEEKGERDDYIDLTVKAVRRRVGYVGQDARGEEMLSELSRALRLDELGRRAVSTYVAGHGNSARASITLDDGYSIEFPSFEHVAQPAKLADQLATTVGIATDFSKIQSRRIAALVRRSASRSEELRDQALYVDEALRLLRLAEPVAFDQADQRSRWETWVRLDATDPEEIPQGAEWETNAERLNRESRAAEAYARRVLIPVDNTDVRFVPARWFQHFVRLRLGSSSTPQQARQAMLRAGWKVRGKDGRMKATDPDSDQVLIFAFYLVPKGWERRQGPGDDG